MDSSAPRGPPDVPPRNPAMSRLNGRLPGSHAASDHERDPDLEPSCVVRTPSGNFYNIPSESVRKQGSLGLIYGRGERGRAAGATPASTWETVFPFAHEYFGRFRVASFTGRKSARNVVFPRNPANFAPKYLADFARPFCRRACARNRAVGVRRGVSNHVSTEPRDLISRTLVTFNCS